MRQERAIRTAQTSMNSHMPVESGECSVEDDETDGLLLCLERYGMRMMRPKTSPSSIRWCAIAPSASGMTASTTG